MTTSPSTPDTTASKPSSGGGSFLDILFQGTQDAVQGAKAAGSQKNGNSDNSDQSSSDEQAVQASSSQKSSSADASAPASQSQTVQPTTNQAGSAQQTAQSNGANTPTKPAQNVPSLLAFANLIVAGSTAQAATSTDAAQASSSNQSAPAGKQTGTSKSTQGKQSAPSTIDSAGSLQQAAALLTQVLTVPAPAPTLPLNTAFSLQVSMADAIGADGSQGALASDGTDATGTSASAGAQAATTAASAQPQQDGNGATPAGNTQFLHDLASTAAAALQASGPNAPADTSNGTQGVAAKPAQSADPSGANQPAANQAVSNTFFAGAVAQNDNTATQTTSKATPSRIAATNLGANVNSTSVTAAGSNSTASSNSVSATSSKNNTQDSSNSSRDGQSSNDASVRAQSDNTQAQNAVRTDNSAQPFVLNAATAHAVAQASNSPTASSDPTPSHVSESRNLPAEPGNTQLPGTSGINTARVIQNMNETEMRVGMRSTEFGDISIRTMVNQQQMQTQISVDHSELVNALTAHIPSVQAKLGSEYGLHASIEVSQGGASFSNNQGQSSSQRDYKPFATSMQFDGTAASAETDRIIARPAPVVPVLEGSRLDIRA